MKPLRSETSSACQQPVVNAAMATQVVFQGLPSRQACPECDLLLAEQRVPEGCESICPRCEHVLHEGRPDSVPRALLLSSCGLLFFPAAMGLPLLSLAQVGVRQEASLTEAAFALINAGYWEIALIVGISAALAPLLNLWLMFSVSYSLHLGSSSHLIASLMRINHKVREWSMLEVFLIGVLVSMVKLIDLATLIPGVGLYCFVCLMLCTLLLRSTVDEHELWQVWEQNQRDQNHKYTA